MMMKSLICLSLVLLPLISVVVEGGLLGGWKPIKDVSDPNVVDIAKYAISEHNKVSKPGLVYEKVVQGKQQVVAGTKYSLVIAAKSRGGGSKNYEAVVWDKPYEKFRKLESFKAV
ncbi:hypothetical protein AALP_AA8G261400 [Arabis alpina]|uniref:Cystatin domain-containing protein n=1 Tax=Arabis alpina TaxID=50452 RepID=A0A087G9I2_ARAAL|nr:hypothetical protein AALP_AA8G261400 [Arabis alpina]